MSEENTNVAPDTGAVAPSEAPNAVTTQAVETTPSEAPLFELPDGKKVDAQTLAKEWTENFYPEYTRKSQELASFKNKPQEQPKEAVKAPWETDPNWTAENYNDLAAPLTQKVAMQVWEEIAKQAEAQENAEKEKHEAVQREVDYIKSIDKDADPHKVMAHATKYQFPSLVNAWQNMKSMEDAVRLAEERAVKNLTNRSQAPVGSAAGAAPTSQIPEELRNASGYEKALWALKNNKV